MIENDFGHNRVGSQIDKVWPLLSTKCFVILLIIKATCIAHELPSTLPTIHARSNTLAKNTKTSNLILCNGWHVTCRPM